MALTVNYNEDGVPNGVPTYLFDQVALYAKDPREAARAWFAAAKLGLSVFFGLHGLIGRHEDVIEREEYPVAEYAALEKQLTAKNFDPIDIVELAIAAGARYLAFPAVYDDGFCLYHSQLTEFNSVHSPAHRDFVGELASVCEYHGLGLSLEYSLGVNHHRWPNGIPATARAEYLEFVQGQIHELLVNYGPVAMLSFNGLKRMKRIFPDWSAQEFYDMARTLQPAILVAYREGHTGTEDFLSLPLDAKVPPPPHGLLELRQTMTPGGRGFNAGEAGNHLKINDLRNSAKFAAQQQAALLVNTALMPDGSLDLEDINTLLEFGK
ncbi:MAG: alpha-L-fucosidase [Victivallales bacterium]|nr:alpha-L-fucosidase [Victivallales bacterium]